MRGKALLVPLVLALAGSATSPGRAHAFNDEDAPATVPGIMRFDLNEGWIDVIPNTYKISITPTSYSLKKEKTVGINLLAPLGWIKTGIQRNDAQPKDTLPDTYVILLGDPDDFSVWMFSALCAKENLMGLRMSYQDVAWRKGELNLEAKLLFGSQVIRLIVERIPWLEQKMDRGPGDSADLDSFCHPDSGFRKAMAGYRLLTVAPKSDSGIFTQFFKAGNHPVFHATWDTTTWKDKIEKESEQASKELHETIKSVWSQVR